MNELNWNEFLNSKSAMHCRSKSEYCDFLKQLEQSSKSCITYETYLRVNDWNNHKENTCYSYDAGVKDLNYFKNSNYKIIEWSDYMSTNSESKLSLRERYLRTGFIVRTKDKKCWLILIYEKRVHLLPLKSPGYLQFPISAYNENLVNERYPHLTVTHVYNRITSNFDIKHLPEAIWTRQHDFLMKKNNH
jgi:hypothetical protein